MCMCVCEISFASVSACVIDCVRYSVLTFVRMCIYIKTCVWICEYACGLKFVGLRIDVYACVESWVKER